MGTITNIVVAFVAVLHVYFLVLEMFLWNKPLGMKTFKNTLEKAEATKILAANQGLYNGFLAAGLFWGLWTGGAEGLNFKLFFLACVVVAGAYGAYSVSKRIFYIQACPAILAIALLLISR